MGRHSSDGGIAPGVVIASVDLVGEVVTITNRSAQSVEIFGLGVG